ncbi:MAG: hypothetical protein KC561_21450, partial [Myxococcales bacterium]|nr:hypothetical protein [Myxococcales bacterium]
DRSQQAPDRAAAEPLQDRGASAAPTLQFRDQVGAMAYQQQVAALQPAVPVQFNRVGEAVQLSDDPTPAQEATATQAGLKFVRGTAQNGTPAWYVMPTQEGETGDPDADPSLSMAAEPQLEAWATAFETALAGQAQSGPGVAGAQAMAAKVLAVMNTFSDALAAANVKAEEIDQIYGRVLGSTSESWAGAVGQGKADLQTVANGTIREQLSMSNWFVWNFGEAVVNQKLQNVREFLTQLEAHSTALSERV